MPPTRLHPDEVAIDLDLAQRLVAARLPDFAGLRLARVASGGTENAVFRLGDDHALRMPLTPGAVGGLLKEVRWLPAISPHVTLEVPEVVATGEPACGYPFPWAVVRWLEGHDALSTPPMSLVDTARALAGFVAELRRIDLSGGPAPGSEGFVRGLPLAGRDDAFRSALARCDGLVDVARVARVWDEALDAGPCDRPPVWLHADLLPGNLLVRGGRLAGVLDFGAMATGDPAYDLTPAWHVLDAESRTVFLDLVGHDEAAVRRARGLVVSSSVIALPYYLHTNPSMVATARRGIEQVLADLG